jgi:multidrug efflux pump subunit AcrB
MKRVLAAFARNTVFANIVLVLIFIAGYIATSNMIRETFPEFSLDMITIAVPYPGADPEEVEEGISRKIEEAIEGLQGIKQYTTQSSEGLGTANIEVREDYDVDEVLDRVRTKVNAISTFPVDAEKPVISELLLKDVVTLLYLSGDMSERRIKEWSEQIKDEIQQLPIYPRWKPSVHGIMKSPSKFPRSGSASTASLFRTWQTPSAAAA